jgi:hypothetical protein
MSYVPEQIPADLLKLMAAGSFALEQVTNGNIFSDEEEAKSKCVDAFDALAITLDRGRSLFPSLINPLERFKAEIQSNNALYALCAHLANGIPVAFEITLSRLGNHEAHVAIEILKAFHRNGRDLFCNHPDFFIDMKEAA